MDRQRRREVEVEAEEALFRFYASALTRYSRFQALLLLAYVTCCGRRHDAHQLADAGVSAREIALRLGVSWHTVDRWVNEPLPRLPRWAAAALTELSVFYAPEDVVEVLEQPWEVAS